jgi:hypothetical protein
MSTNNEKVLLYFENKKIILQVNEQKHVFLRVDTQEEVFGKDRKHKYVFDVFVEGNSILVGSTYTFVNKYGSSVYLKHFRYENNVLKETWSSEELLKYKITINEFINESNILKVLVNDRYKEIKIAPKDRDEFLSFLEFYKKNSIEIPLIEPRLITSYKVDDEVNNFNKRIVLKMPVTCGASPIQDELISVYYLSKEGFKISDQWFESKNKEY